VMPRGHGPETSGKRADQRRGRLAELLAAALLVTKGYRILARRYRGPGGEIDLIAVRGRRLAFVEVKRRASLIEARTAVTSGQARRIGEMAESWVWRHPVYREHTIGLDAVYFARGWWPRHEPHALDG
jgi:putative endonuclease